MDTNIRKVGRPKAPPRTGPLVLEDDRGRTKVTLEISDRAAGELVEYARWVEHCSGIAAGEAKFKTVDFALREIFRRDGVWQAQRRASAASAPEPAPASAPLPSTSAAPASAPPPTPRAPATTSPSPPPPPPRDPRPNS
jgi:hypothetical protein